MQISFSPKFSTLGVTKVKISVKEILMQTKQVKSLSKRRVCRYIKWKQQPL